MSLKLTNTPSPKHSLAQTFLYLHGMSKIPPKYNAQVHTEYKIIKEKEMRLDVLMRYWKRNSKKHVVYEIQNKMEEKQFVKKIDNLRNIIKNRIPVTDNFKLFYIDDLVVIDESEIPDDITEAWEWIGERIVWP